jgi:cell division septation protein DedD
LHSYSQNIDNKIDSSYFKSTSQELILYNLINDMRLKAGLAAIPQSEGLGCVAKTHIHDIIRSQPLSNGCDLKSWSDKGKWTSCCQPRGKSAMDCMKQKPAEIIGYEGNGYELIYWSEEIATPSDAIASWQSIQASTDMILNKGKWKAYAWKALGVGIVDGMAVLWFGDRSEKPKIVETNNEIAEHLKEPQVNHTTQIESEAKKDIAKVVVSTDNEDVKQSKKITANAPETQISIKLDADKPVETKKAVAEKSVTSELKQPVIPTTGKYYLIAGSLKTIDGANSELKKIKAKGYPEAFVMDGGSIFRVVIGVYHTAADASAAQRSVKQVFADAWVYKQSE